VTFLLISQTLSISHKKDKFMESGQNQVINVSKTTSSSINGNNQKENFAEGSGSGATAANTTGSLKSGVPLPKPNLNPTSTGKKVGSKSKKNVEQHNNNNGSSGDAATSNNGKKKGNNTINGRKNSKKNGEAAATSERAGDGSTSGDVFHDALAPEEAQQKAAKSKKKKQPKKKKEHALEDDVSQLSLADGAEGTMSIPSPSMPGGMPPPPIGRPPKSPIKPEQSSKKSSAKPRGTRKMVAAQPIAPPPLPSGAPPPPPSDPLSANAEQRKSVGKTQGGTYVPPSQREGRKSAGKTQKTAAKSPLGKKAITYDDARGDPDYDRNDPSLIRGGASHHREQFGHTSLSGRSSPNAHASLAEEQAAQKQAKKEQQKKEKPAPPKLTAEQQKQQATGREIRRFLDSNDINGALDVFYAKRDFGGIDVEGFKMLVAGCVKMAAIQDGLRVVEYAKSKGLKISLRNFTGLLQTIPQRSNPMDTSDLLAALEYVIDYEDRRVRNYHFHFAKLIVQEFLEEALQTLDRVANAPAFGLQENGLAAMDVRLEPLRKPGQVGLTIPVLAAEMQKNLMKGDAVLLSRTSATKNIMTLGELPKHSKAALEAAGESTLKAISLEQGERPARRSYNYSAAEEYEAEVCQLGNNVAVRLLGVDPRDVPSISGSGWRVDKLANRTSYLRQLNALQDLMEMKGPVGNKPGVDPGIRDILLAGWDNNKKAIESIPDLCAAELNEDTMHAATKQRMLDMAQDIPAMQHMNKSQHEALRAALFQRITLIQGPPGTGKTHTAVALVQMWLKCRKMPILCTSDSNIAVDNLVDGLSRAGVRVARIGRPEAVRQDLMPFMVESIAGIEPGSNMSKDQQYQAINGVLRRAEVICATCAGAGSDILERFSFAACLIDEATQATEPATVVPMTKGCKQIVLIGDQNQLPPTIISRDADERGLGTSLFERMLSRGIRTFMLKVQYRMHPAIAKFPSQQFYNNELLSGTPPSQRRAPQGFDWPVPAVPLAFVDCPEGEERSDGASQMNMIEAQKVVTLVRKLMAEHEVLACDIGIVSPYAAQVRAIKKLLQPNAVKRTRFDAPAAPDSEGAIEVCSIDGFQGREKEVIVFSCTRANLMGNVGFLADRRRVNVMLTRARRGLIIVGHLRTLRGEPEVWGPWLSWAGENGLICGLSATDADAANSLATIGMSSYAEIGGSGVGETVSENAMLVPSAWADDTKNTGMHRIESGSKLVQRDHIPEAWDDSDDENADVDAIVPSASVSSFVTSMLSTDDQGPDSAWDEDDDAEETTNTSVVTSSTDREDGSGDEA
jgi:hypothetical protein